MQPAASPTGVVIVTYNSAEVIGRCVESALAVTPDVVVVDNASTDATQAAARATGARLVTNEANLGFAAAVNQGIRALPGVASVLILNPDAVLRTGIDPLVTALQDPGVAVAAGRLVDAAGRTQRGFTVRRFPTPAALVAENLGINRLWPSNPANRRYRCLDLNLDRANDVEQPAGAFLLVRRDVWEAVGGFDESFYPIWFEDVDFLARVAQQGYRIRYDPASVAEHVGAHSIRPLDPDQRASYWYGSLLKYSHRRFSSWDFRLVAASVAAGVFVRMICHLHRPKSAAHFGRIALAAWNSFLSGAPAR